MAHNTTLNAGTGGDTITDYDIAAGGAYPTTGKVQQFGLFLSPNTSTAPTPFTTGQKTMANSLGVAIASDQGAVPVSGTITVSNLFALESGGNLAAAAASLNVIDDWDETDRCKVNLIAGQAGVQGGSGVVTALTQRVALATDVALPAGTNNIGDVDVLTVPTDPFGANADAASATGSISAKLRFIAATGIPITGSVTVGTVTAVTSITNALPAGNNNIGDVDVVTVPADPFGANADAASATGSISAKLRFIAATGVPVTSLPAIPAGTNLIGQVAASPETNTIYNGTTALTPKFAKISCSASGENTLVSLVSSKKIRVHAIALFVVGTAISIYFKDGAGGTAIFADATNPIPVDKTGANGAGGFVLGYNPLGWFQSASGAALILNLSGAQAVAGGLLYSEV